MPEYFPLVPTSVRKRGQQARSDSLGRPRHGPSLVPATVIRLSFVCRATITFTWPRKLSPRSPRRPLAAASARSRLAGDNNRGQLVTVIIICDHQSYMAADGHCCDLAVYEDSQP